MPKPEIEFSLLSDVEWSPAPGYPPGVEEEILSRDETSGDCTRLLRFEPGAASTQTLSHDFWEEVYILKGGLIDLRLRQAFSEGSYACRPPRMAHGPFSAPVGCLTLEIRSKLQTGADRSP